MNERILNFIIKVESQLDKFERELANAGKAVTILDQMNADIPVIIENMEQFLAQIKLVRKSVENLDNTNIDIRATLLRVTEVLIELQKIQQSVRSVDGDEASIRVELNGMAELMTVLQKIRSSVESLDRRSIDIRAALENMPKFQADVQIIDQTVKAADRQKIDIPVELDGTKELLAELMLIRQAIIMMDKQRATVKVELVGVEVLTAEIAALTFALNRIDGRNINIDAGKNLKTLRQVNTQTKVINQNINDINSNPLRIIPADNTALYLLAALTGVLSPLVPLLAGAGVQLASFIDIIGTGLVGALAAGGSGLTLFASALGLSAWAIQNAIVENDKLKSSFLDLGRDISGAVGDLAENLVSPLQRIVDLLDRRFIPVIQEAIRSAADPLADALRNIFTQLANVRQLQLFSQVMDTIARNTGPAIQLVANLGLSILNIFSSLDQIAEDFLGRLVELTTKFVEWSRSVEGQNALTTFFNDAYATAGRLVGIIIDLGAAFGGFLGALRESGATEVLFGQIERLAQSMRNFTAEGSRGRDMIIQFAQNIQPTMDAAWSLVGRVVTEFAKMADQMATLRDESGNLMVPQFFKDIEALLPQLRVLFVTTFEQIGSELPTLLGNILGVIQAFVDTGIAGALVRAINSILTAFNKLPDSMKVAIAGGAGLALLWTKLGGPVKTTLKLLGGIPGAAKAVGGALKLLAAGQVGAALKSLTSLNKKGLEPVDKELQNKDQDTKKAGGGFTRLKGWIATAAGAAAGFVTTMAGKLGPILTKVLGWFKPLGPAVSAVGRFIAGIAPTVLRLVSAFGRFTVVQIAIRAVIAAVGALVAAVSAPVAIVVGVIAGLVAVGYLVYRNWSSIGPKLAAIWESIKNAIGIAINAVIGVVKTVGQGVAGAWTSAWNLLKSIVGTAWNAIRGVVMRGVNAVKGAVQTAWNAVKSVTQTAWNAIKVVFYTTIGLFILAWRKVGPPLVTGIKATWNLIKNTTSAAWKAIVNAVKTVWNTLKNIVTGVINGVKSALSAAWNGIKNAASAAWKAIVNVVKSVWGSIKNVIGPPLTAVKNFIQNAWNGIKTNTNSVWNSIKNFMKSVWNGIKSAVQSVLTPIVNFIKTQWNNVKKGWTIVWNSIKSFMSSIWNAIKKTVQSILGPIVNFIKTQWENVKKGWTIVWNAIKNFFSGIWKAISGVVKSAVDAVKNAISTAWNAVKNATSSAWKAVSDVVKNAWTGIVNAVKSAVGNVVDAVGNIGGDILDAIGDFVGDMYNMGKDLIQGLINGIIAMAKNAASAVGNLLKDAYEAGKAAINAGSPSKLMHQLGEWMGEGVLNGIAKTASDVHKSAWAMGKIAIDKMRDAVKRSRPEEVGRLMGEGFRKGLEDSLRGLVRDEDGSLVPKSFNRDRSTMRQVQRAHRGMTRAEDGSWVPKDLYSRGGGGPEHKRRTLPEYSPSMREGRRMPPATPARSAPTVVFRGGDIHINGLSKAEAKRLARREADASVDRAFEEKGKQALDRGFTGEDV